MGELVRYPTDGGSSVGYLATPPGNPASPVAAATPGTRASCPANAAGTPR